MYYDTVNETFTRQYHQDNTRENSVGFSQSGLSLRILEAQLHGSGVTGKNKSQILDLITEIENMVEFRVVLPSGADPVQLRKDKNVSWAVANVLSLPLSQAARILLISSLLGSNGEDLTCRFNELASLSGLSERTAYRALKEIKQSGIFDIRATPGSGVRISAKWLWDEPGDRAREILQNRPAGKGAERFSS
jgi:hypothetical protein